MTYKDEIPGFAKKFIIPFGNNIAEQTIGIACPDPLEIKVEQKIAGCFRSKQGATDFATIRSDMATLKKQGTSIMQALQAIINGNPIFPSLK